MSDKANSDSDSPEIQVTLKKKPSKRLGKGPTQSTSHRKPYEAKTAQDLEWERMMGAQRDKPRQANTARFTEFELRKKERLEKLSKERTAEISANCTFKPTTNPDKNRRSLDEFLQEQEKFTTRKQEKIEAMRLQKQVEKQMEESAVASHHPSLCKNSIVISRRLSSYGEPVHEKLYQNSKVVSYTVETSGEFIPEVNQRSKEMLRTEPVSQLLYKDALRRQAKSKEKPNTPNIEVITSNGSQRVLIEKLAKEIDFVFSELDPEGEGVLRYSKFIAFLERMRLIKNNMDHPRYTDEKELVMKAWNLISLQEHSVTSKENVVILLLCIMNLFPGTEEQHHSSFGSSMGTIIHEVFTVTDEEAKHLHKHFWMLFENRNSPVKQQKAQEDPYSFRPEILEHSEKLAEKARSKRQGNYFDYLVGNKKQKEEECKRRKSDIEQETMKHCTFKPQINDSFLRNEGTAVKQTKADRNLTLYEMAKAKKPNIELTTEEKKLQRNLRECSFQPDISKASVRHEQRDSDSDDDVSVTVNLPNGGVANLVIRPEDDPQECIDQFVQKYQLSQVVSDQLRTELLENLSD